MTVSDISILSSLGDLFSNNIVFTFIEKENTCHFKKNHYFSETLRYSVLQHCIHTPTLGNSCTASWAFWLKYITPDIFFSPLPDLWGAEHIWKIQTVFFKKKEMSWFSCYCVYYLFSKMKGKSANDLSKYCSHTYDVHLENYFSRENLNFEDELIVIPNLF